MRAMDPRPRIALTVGDPAGIGPELVHAALFASDLRERMRLLVLGPASSCPPGVAPQAEGAPDSGEDVEWRVPAELAPLAGGPVPWAIGRAQASAGAAALAALRLGARLAQAREVDALVTAPVCKEALHLAGEPCEGQSELLGRWAGAQVEMLAIAGNLRVLLLTRHMPLRAALDAIEPERVVAHLALLHDGLVGLGYAAPRLALAGVNPHAGEAGILGREELDLLAPALRTARARGLDVTGPEPPDTVFLRALGGRFDGVLALYHDQAFIPVKLAAPKTALTVLLGLPYLRVSPAHGTAFDIAGTGAADPGNLLHALESAAEWSRRRERAAQGAS